MANQFNTLDLTIGSSRIIKSNIVAISQNVITLVSPANPRKTKVIIESTIAGTTYFVFDGVFGGIFISSTVGSTYPVLIEVPTQDNVYVQQTAIIVGNVGTLEFFN